jgi:hypothetical protein
MYLNFIIGKDSVGYSPIGGFSSSSNAVGFLGILQTTGDSNLGQAQSIGGGAANSAGGTAYILSQIDQAGTTVKNLKPLDITIASPTSSTVCAIPTQFWVTANDKICLKLSVNNTLCPYEVTYSFIFITEVP